MPSKKYVLRCLRVGAKILLILISLFGLGSTSKNVLATPLIWSDKLLVIWCFCFVCFYSFPPIMDSLMDDLESLSEIT